MPHDSLRILTAPKGLALSLQPVRAKPAPIHTAGVAFQYFFHFFSVWPKRDDVRASPSGANLSPVNLQCLQPYLLQRGQVWRVVFALLWYTRFRPQVNACLRLSASSYEHLGREGFAVGSESPVHSLVSVHNVIRKRAATTSESPAVELLPHLS
jgi:hypothetical protein